MPILCIVGFLCAVWSAGRLSRFVGVSSIVLEILTGLLFAPGVLLQNGLLDAAGGHQADMFVLVGHAGVAMMIFESGMHFDFQKAKEVGPWACVVAILGTGLPLVAGMLLAQAFGSPLYPDGLAVGVSLAPTSVGIALKLLMEAKCLQKDFGQAIITAAFVDDILSLIAFNVLFSMSSGPIDPFAVVGKPLIGIVFMLVAGSMGISFWPRVVQKIEGISMSHGSRKCHDEALLVLLFALLIAYGTLTHFLGTHLWGCFVAGMSFATVPHAHHLWSHQTKRITRWTLRIFFSCTVAFAIPFDTLFTLQAFWKGSVMGIVACIATKVLCAFFMGGPKWVIGWAMVGRAEFAYLIAEMAVSGGLMTPEMFSIVIWALLYATVFAPFVFRKVLANYANKLRENMALAMPEALEAGKGKGGANVGLRFEIEHTQGGDSNLKDVTEVAEVFKQYNMCITHSVQHSDSKRNYSIFQVQSQDGEELEEDALEFLKQEIASEFEVMDVKLKFLPSHSGEFMTQGMAHLDEETLGAVAEVIKSISESNLGREKSLDILRGMSEKNLAKDTDVVSVNI
jgi:Kef-type K+ transport system membrane component KefB